jgi:hypothetical protein
LIGTIVLALAIVADQVADQVANVDVPVAIVADQVGGLRGQGVAILRAKVSEKVNDVGVPVR